MKIISLLTLLFVTGTLFSQKALEAGVVYPGGSFLKVDGLGVNFKVPSNWQGALDANAGVFLLEPAQADATAMFSGDVMSQDELRAFYLETIPYDTFSGLSPQGNIMETGSVMHQDYSTYGMPGYEGFVASRVGNKGIGIVVILIATPDRIGGYKQALISLLSGAKFYTPVEPEPEALPGQQNVSDWKKYLKGRYLHYLKTANGLSSEESIWLCSDGSFAFSSNENYLSTTYTDTFSSASSSGEIYGEWTVSGSTLILNGEDGSVRKFQCQLTDEGVFLNGYRYFRDNNTRCQ